MQPEDFAYLYELETDFWWFVGMREITAALLDPVCPPGIDREVLDDGSGTGGNLTSDAHLAALALEHHGTVVTYDSDFGRFPGLDWQQPWWKILP